MSVKSLLSLLVLMLLVYPMALILQIGIDTGLGDGEFLDWLKNGRKRVLVTALITDWLAAAPVIAGVFGGLVLLGLAGRGNTTMTWVFRSTLAVLAVSPLLPMVPLLLGFVLAFSSLGAGIWSWKALS